MVFSVMQSLQQRIRAAKGGQVVQITEQESLDLKNAIRWDPETGQPVFIPALASLGKGTLFGRPIKFASDLSVVVDPAD